MLSKFDFNCLVDSNAVVSVGGYYIIGFNEETKKPILGNSAGSGLWPFSPKLGTMWHHLETGNGYTFVRVNPHLCAWVKTTALIERGITL